ncbi:MAG: 6-pyruvoyl-tetrahydropterin synthase-related protein [Anaerolineae bacterium]|nr:6-pyruvoyl-tetrahydropterin synthase-related protein [Anaerolineae bacterium]
MNRRWPLLIALALAALAAAPLLSSPGFLNTRAGGDSPFLLFRLHQLHAALSEGVFPSAGCRTRPMVWAIPSSTITRPWPSTSRRPSRGWASPTSLASKLAHLAGFLLAGGAMYAWMRRYTRSRWGALLASAAYTFAPFHMVNVYVRGDSLAEFFAFAWYPLTLLAVDRLLERRSGPRAAGLALAYAGLLLTHNISAFIFSPFLLLYLLLMGARRAAPLRGYAAGALALVLGAVLAAWFWLPALGELHLAQLAPSTTGYFHYSNHFRGGDLIQASLAFDYAINPDAPLTPFSFGGVQAALAAAGATALLWRRVARREAEPPAAFSGALLLGLALAAFLITPASRALWDSLPLLAVVQFPWRFLSVAALFAAGLGGYAADAFAGGLGRAAGRAPLAGGGCAGVGRGVRGHGAGRPAP